MKKFFYLGTCSTCARIIKDTGINPKIAEFREIKTEPITGEELDEMKRLAGSYEALFSRVALKYRALGLHEKKLGEADYRKYILEEYTFLKRPVLLWGSQVFVGNSKANVAAMAAAIKPNK